MQGAVLYGPRDVRFEEREAPKIIKPTDAVIRLSATCICGSDLWPFRGIQPIAQPTQMGHEYCGIVKRSVKRLRKSSPANSWSARLRRPTTLASSASTGISLRASDASS
jgi:D-arabinose 1-dehydrogenase-like Zn-dependent alcohol dehydrogenase